MLGVRLALSLSAFVLQLLKDKDHLGLEYGRTSFGVMLLQDLSVVPLLVAIPILAGGNKSLGEALVSSYVQAVVLLGIINLFGKFLLKPLFGFMSASGSQEAFLGVLLSTVPGMLLLNEGLGLSNILGTSSPECFCRRQNSVIGSRPRSPRSAEYWSGSSYSR